MKVLVFYGSTGKRGRTKAALDYFLSELGGEIDIIDCYKTRVAACIDCGYCWKKRGCSIKDEMQEIYQKIDEADVIVCAAPMFFHCVPGPMKTMIDRLQVYWAGVIRGDHPEKPTKKGAIIMVGGAPLFDRQFEAGEIVLKGVLGDCSAECMGVFTFPNTDRETFEEHEEFKVTLKEIAQKCK